MSSTNGEILRQNQFGGGWWLAAGDLRTAVTACLPARLWDGHGDAQTCSQWGKLANFILYILIDKNKYRNKYKIYILFEIDSICTYLLGSVVPYYWFIAILIFWKIQKIVKFFKEKASS